MKASLVALAFCMLALSVSAKAEHTRVTNPNAVGAEVLGRGLLYSLYYDRVMNDDLSAGFGFGSVGTNLSGGSNSDANASMLPVYFNYYFMREQGSIFVTGGATLLLNGSSVKDRSASASGVDFGSRAVLPIFGVGYENRGDSGFLFRFTAYGVLGNSLVPWGGFSFGYAF